MGKQKGNLKGSENERGGVSLTNTLETTPWERQVRQLCKRYGTDDIDEAIKRERENMSIADGLMMKAFCRNPKCRKTFEIPENNRVKPKLCPECRAKEGGIWVSEETKCSIEGCEEERVLHRAVCKKHYNEAQRRSREGGLKPGRKPGKKPARKPVTGGFVGQPIDTPEKAAKAMDHIKVAAEAGARRVEMPIEEAMGGCIGAGRKKVALREIELLISRVMDENDLAYSVSAAVWGYLYGRGLAA